MNASFDQLIRGQLAAVRQSQALLQLLSFLAVGGAGALSFTLVSTIAIAALSQYPAWIVSACCYAAHIVPVYLLHRRFAFQATTTAHTTALPRYVAVQLCGIALAALFSWIAYGVIGMPSILAALLVTGLTSGVNFVVLRLWAFSNS